MGKCLKEFLEENCFNGEIEVELHPVGIVEEKDLPDEVKNRIKMREMLALKKGD